MCEDVIVSWHVFCVSYLGHGLWCVVCVECYMCIMCGVHVMWHLCVVQWCTVACDVCEVSVLWHVFCVMSVVGCMIFYVLSVM